MKPDPAGVKAVLSERVDLEALYLGGPFDTQGEPASPDLHLLAVSRGDLVKDLHLVPGISRFERRVEVSVVPLGLLRQTVKKGISSWFTFYTADKIRTGKPILESPEVEALRRLALENVKIRPSFLAAAMRGVVVSAGHLVGPSDRASASTGPRQDDLGAGARSGAAGQTQAPAPSGIVAAMAAAALNARLLALLALHTAVKSGRTFSKLSEMLSRGAPFPARLPQASKADAARALAATARTLESLFASCGINPARLAPAPAPTATGQAPQGAEGQQGATQ